MSRGSEVPHTQRGKCFNGRSPGGASCGKQGHLSRCLVVIMLLSGISREQVVKATTLSESAVKKIIRAFNLYGVDGLIARKRPGRSPVIGDQQKEDILEEFEEPGRAQKTFWTATAFHGHVRDKYRIECSYSTVVRLLHEKGCVLKVP